MLSDVGQGQAFESLTQRIERQAQEVKGAGVTLRRVTEITVETEDTVTLRTQHGAPHLRCSQCGSPAATLTHPASVAVFWAALRTVRGQPAPDRIHVAKTATGSTIICLDSLRRAAPDLAGKSILEINPNKENSR